MIKIKEQKLTNKKDNIDKINIETGNFKSTKAITLIALAISRKCVRYEERA